MHAQLAQPSWPQLLGSPNLALLQAALPGEEPGAIEGLNLAFAATDGALLHGRVFEPQGAARAVAVLAPATGVPQRYYQAFAQWLAARGYAVLSFDYRGMGASRAAGAGRASMRDWIRLDLSAALAAARERAGRGPQRLPILWVGHSLGGNGLPMVEGLAHLDAAITVGSQFGYWGLWPAGWHRTVTRVFFSHWVPLCVRLTGRLPGWALGGGETLPGPAALDWSRWGRSAGYFTADPACRDWYRPQDFKGHLQLWSVADDLTYGPAPAVDALARCFEHAGDRVERVHLHPQEIGLKRLGHFGPFRRAAGERLWPLLLERIEAKVPALRPGY
ncbi:alpha/beta fold hydrolase [Inhella sp.]|uniref:alpha/beta hydrolase family protein n=1 Tax=Inhella sp. TaxID=1921806 RepID=UPI0035AF171B